MPRFMYQAQREANVQNARTILIDADKGDCGRPNYLRADSAFRKQFPEIELVNVDSADYVALAKRQNLTIDYLHIDGDHSYEGALADFLNYFPLMSSKGLVTLHDTNGRYSCADVVKTLKDMGYTIINLPDVRRYCYYFRTESSKSEKRHLKFGSRIIDQEGRFGTSQHCSVLSSRTVSKRGCSDQRKTTVPEFPRLRKR